jgi:tetratricopeptide (TPR) repeat protein
LIETLDQLTPWIKTRFNLSRLEIADDIDKKIGEILSNSPEALKFYYEAEELFRKRDFSQCIMVLEEAVEIDPEFAMAYRMIAKCYAVKDDPEKVKQNFSKALEFLYRLSDRERYLIQASYMSWVEKYNVKAIRIYQELLNIYPDDETANILLADIYRYFEEWDLAIQLFEKVLDINKKSVDAISKLPFVYLAKGLYDKTQNLLQANKKIFSNQAFYHKNLCHLFLCQGNYELALSEIEKTIHLEPENYSHLIFEGIIYQSKENFEQAEKIYKKLLENKDPAAQLQARLLLGELYSLQGKYKKSKKEIIQSISSPRNIYSKNLHLSLLLLLVYFDLRENLDAEAYDFINQAMEVVFKTDLIDMQKIVLHYRGLVLLKMNNIEMAKETSHQLKELIAKTGNKKNMRFYYHLMGMISLHNEQVPEAIEYFEKAVSLLSFQVFTLSNHSFYFDSLAFAYDKKGDIEKAREFYEKIIELPLGKLQFGDIYAKSYYLLGKIYQKKDWKEKAIENYKNFLHLWKDADTSLPEVINAEKQLAILKDNTQK